MSRQPERPRFENVPNNNICKDLKLFSASDLKGLVGDLLPHLFYSLLLLVAGPPTSSYNYIGVHISRLISVFSGCQCLKDVFLEQHSK